MNDVTIVTAFLDIGRGSWKNFQRDHTFYLNNFKNLTGVRNDLIVFTESRFFEDIRAMREDVRLVSIDHIRDEYSGLIQSIGDIQKSAAFKNFVYDKTLPEYNHPEYVFINYMKSFFLTTAIDNGMVKTDTSAWIDFGYVRQPEFCPTGTILKFDTKNKINIFTMTDNLNFSYDQIKEIVRRNIVTIQGCHIVAPNHLWPWLFERMTFNLNRLMMDGFVDDDQTILLMSYLDDPSKFNKVKANGRNWFNIFIENNHV